MKIVTRTAPYIDAHSHLADSRFDADRDAVVRRAISAGVGRFIQGGVDPDDWRKQLALRAQCPGVIPCFGMHPWWVAQAAESQCEAAWELLVQMGSQSVGIGELGLDYLPCWDSSTHDRQRRWFIRQLELAINKDKPLVLHIVRAHDDALRILGEHGVPRRGGIVHAFSGSWELAQRYLSLGLHLSVGGPLVRASARKLARAVTCCPPERLLLESDAPDQPPPQFHGRLNEPASITFVAETVAALKGLDAEQVLRQSTANSVLLFGLEARYD